MTFSCPRCRTPYMVAAMDAEAEGRALDSFACPCSPPRLPIFEPDADMRTTAAVLSLAAVLWLALIVWFVGRLVGAW